MPTRKKFRRIRLMLSCPQSTVESELWTILSIEYEKS
jgi:hypothetical protein